MTSYITHLSMKIYGLDRIKCSYERVQAPLCWLCVYSAVGAAEKTPRSCIITELRNEIYMRVRVRLSAFGKGTACTGGLRPRGKSGLVYNRGVVLIGLWLDGAYT